MKRRERVPRSALRFFDRGGALGLGAAIGWLIRGAIDGDPLAIVGAIFVGVLCVVVGVAAFSERERRGDL